QIRQLVERADFLKLSDEEADLLFGTCDPGAIAQQLSQVTGVLVTAGEQGCSYCIRNYQGQLPAFPVAVVETTGAGDGFLAGFLHKLNQLGLVALDDPQQVHAIVTYACAVGALTVTKAGAIAAQPTTAEVEAFLSRI
ncbi:MAG: carbohydrate kinase, partial [Cyanothece sp. SIO2G6]|nr:carbohydrate kinase [Cyanothece sp. SIO2G6]